MQLLYLKMWDNSNNSNYIPQNDIVGVHAAVIPPAPGPSCRAVPGAPVVLVLVPVVKISFTVKFFVDSLGGEHHPIEIVVGPI